MVMLSPNRFYDGYFQGKSEQEIRRVIDSLQSEIDEIKYQLELPKYGLYSFLFKYSNPSLDCLYTGLDLRRKYLEKARLALVEMRAVYATTDIEKRTAEFEANMDFISQISIELIGIKETSVLRSVDISKSNENSFSHVRKDIGGIINIGRERFLEEIKALHISEWQNEYLSGFEDYLENDIVWKVKIEYSNDIPSLDFHGVNKFPYNFSMLCNLMGIDMEFPSTILETERDYVLAHAHSENHKIRIERSHICDCFYCRSIFDSKEIEDWIPDSKGTAVCPYCGIDSVIGRLSGYPITKDF